MSDNTTNADAEAVHEPVKRGPGRPPGGPGGPGRTPTEMPADQWAEVGRELVGLVKTKDDAARVLERAQDAVDHSVHAAHTAGASWAQIATALGVSRQSVYRRYVTGKTTAQETDR
ncbi:MAG: helix-turn-helix domain-containing protein [Pseudonocardiaceae bacterium]